MCPGCLGVAYAAIFHSQETRYLAQDFASQFFCRDKKKVPSKQIFITGSTNLQSHANSPIIPKVPSEQKPVG